MGLGRTAPDGSGDPAGEPIRIFGWLSATPPAPNYDLRRRGWRLAGEAGPIAPATMPLLVDDPTFANLLHHAQKHAAVVLLKVDDPEERARALALGFGDAFPSEITLAELDERVRRLATALVNLRDRLPRIRQCGDLRLDLLARDGFVEERRMGLHPREFALLWRLAEKPGEAISAQALISDVWRMNFRPETNSLAVHVCRLRGKLALHGFANLIRTTPAGGYYLDPDCAVFPLDATPRPGRHKPTPSEDPPPPDASDNCPVARHCLIAAAERARF